MTLQEKLAFAFSKQRFNKKCFDKFKDTVEEAVTDLSHSESIIKLDLKLSKGTVFKSKIFAKFLALILFLFEIDKTLSFFIRCLIDSLEVSLAPIHNIVDFKRLYLFDIISTADN